MQAAAAAVNTGDYFEPAKMTVGAWLDIWLKDYTGDKKYLTVKHYTAQIETHIRPALGAVKLGKLTTPQIQGFYNELGRTGHKIEKKDKKTGKVTVTYELLSPLGTSKAIPPIGLRCRAWRRKRFTRSTINKWPHSSKQPGMMNTVICSGICSG